MPTHTSVQRRPRRVHEQRDFLRRFLDDHSPLSTAEIKLGLNKLQPQIARRIKGPPSPESQAFVTSAVRTIGRIRSTSNVELRIQCLFDCAIYCYNNGDTTGFLTTIQLLDGLARHCSSTDWIRRIEMFGGVCHADIGNVAEAVVRYAKALDISREANDICGEVATLCNLGGALNYGGLHREAIPSLRLAIRLAQDHRDIVDARMIEGQKSYFQCVALTNLAQSYYMIGNNDAALDAIAHCMSLTPAPTTSLSATNLMLRVYTFTNVALDLRLIPEAQERVAQARPYRSQAGSRGQFMFDVACANCLVHAGSTKDGISGLEALLERADLASTKTAVLRALARAFDLCEQPSRALGHIEMLIEIISATRSKTTSVLLSALPLKKDWLSSESDDLSTLRLARAEYRARAAENDAAGARIEALERLAIAADLKEESSGGHGHRVGRLVSAFASKLGWDKAACHSIDLAGRLHDIGKIGLPDRLMLKPATLAEAERKYVTAHSEIGVELLSQGSGELLKMARDVARCHHERWDGSGYPVGLRESGIPLSARLVALADVYDALTHGRPYSLPSSPKAALMVIREELGRQFDPHFGQLFIEFVSDLAENHPDLDRFLGEGEQVTAFADARRRINSLLSARKFRASDDSLR